MSIHKYGGDILRKIPLTEYGKSVKKRLIEMDKSQAWLIEQLKRKTGKFVDSSLLNKILTGKSNSSTIISAINELISEKN